jgi:hypothetical protein
MAKGGDKKQGEKKEQYYFVLAGSLNGTNAAFIKTTSLKKAYLIYSLNVIIPVKQKVNFDPKCVKDNKYYDGYVYVERVKRYKKIKKHKVAILDGTLKLEGVHGFAEGE